MCFVLIIVSVTEMYDTVEHLMNSIDVLREELREELRENVTRLELVISDLKADMILMKKANKARNITMLKSMIELLEDDDVT